MEKLGTQAKYFINGLILLLLGLFSITILPGIVGILDLRINIENYFYVELEFFLFCACSIFYLFSPKYFKYQFLSIIYGFIYYFLFVKFY